MLQTLYQVFQMRADQCGRNLFLTFCLTVVKGIFQALIRQKKEEEEREAAVA